MSDRQRNFQFTQDTHASESRPSRPEGNHSPRCLPPKPLKNAKPVQIRPKSNSNATPLQSAYGSNNMILKNAKNSYEAGLTTQSARVPAPTWTFTDTRAPQAKCPPFRSLD